MYHVQHLSMKFNSVEKHSRCGLYHIETEFKIFYHQNSIDLSRDRVSSIELSLSTSYRCFTLPTGTYSLWRQMRFN